MPVVGPCGQLFFSPENHAVYEVKWLNIVEWGGPQMHA